MVMRFLHLYLFVGNLWSFVDGRARRTPRCTPLDVAIVGAGPSGSYAAYRLGNSGLRVGLFEYSNRIGGRVYTDSPPNGPDLNYELGAMRFLDGVHVRLQRVIDELGLTEKIFTQGFGRPGNTRYYWRGESVDSVNGSAEVPFDLDPEEKANLHRIFEFYFERLTGIDLQGRPLTREQEMTLRVRDDGRLLYTLTFDEAMDLVASPEGKEFMKSRLLFGGTVDEEVSIMVALHEFLGEGSGHGEILTVAEGMMSIPIGMAEAFVEASKTNKLYTNSQLAAIRRKSNGVYSLLFKGTVTRPDGQSFVSNYRRPRRVCARQVILAVPRFALESIDWEPLQSPVYDIIKCFQGSKVFMTFNKPWWREAPNSADVTFSDLDFSHFYHWDRSNETGVYSAIVSYSDVNKSERQEDLKRSGPPIEGSKPGFERVSESLKEKLLVELAQAYGLSRDDIPEPLSAQSYFWSSYPFGCSWRHWKAGYHWTDGTSAMRRPSLKEEVYVVGSDYAWGPNTGWIEGGLELVDVVLENYFNVPNYRY